MTFQAFFHDLLQFSSAIALAATFKKFQNYMYLSLREFLRQLSSTGTNPGLQHKNCVAFAPFNSYCLCLIFLSFDINSD